MRLIVRTPRQLDIATAAGNRSRTHTLNGWISEWMRRWWRWWDNWMRGWVHLSWLAQFVWPEKQSCLAAHPHQNARAVPSRVCCCLSRIFCTGPSHAWSSVSQLSNVNDLLDLIKSFLKLRHCFQSRYPSNRDGHQQFELNNSGTDKQSNSSSSMLHLAWIFKRNWPGNACVHLQLQEVDYDLNSVPVVGHSHLATVPRADTLSSCCLLFAGTYFFLLSWVLFLSPANLFKFFSSSQQTFVTTVASVEEIQKQTKQTSE